MWLRTANKDNWLFHVAFYSSQVQGRMVGPEEAWTHFQSKGRFMNLAPHPLFLPDYYTRIYEDVSDLNSFTHFVEFGDRELRRPHPLFDPIYYLQFHSAHCTSSDILSGPLRHFLKCSIFTSPTPLWNPDLTSSQLNLTNDKQLFLRYLSGEESRIQPHVLFDEHYFEVESMHRQSVQPALVQYASPFGDDRARVRSHPLIDEAWYLHRHGTNMQPWQSVLESVILTGNQSTPDLNMDAFIRVAKRPFELEKEVVRARQAVLPSQTDVAALVINIDSPAATFMAIAALRKSDGSIPVSVYILDNASSNPEDPSRIAKLLPDVRVISSPTRISFGEANNQLSELSSESLILLLNNDALISASGLSFLKNELIKSEKTAAVGPRFVYPNGMIQEVGGQFATDGTPIQLYRGRAYLPEINQHTRPTDYVSAACCLIKRTAFEAVSGFSLVFEPAYFEDTDLCRRLAEVGDILTVPEVEVAHFEGLSTNKNSILSNKDSVQAIARSKWSTRFERKPTSPKSESLLRETSHDVTSRFKSEIKTLVYSPFGLMIGGGERYLLSLALQMQNYGPVTLSFPMRNSSYRLKHVLHELGLPVRNLNISHFESIKINQVDVFVCMSNTLRPPIRAQGRFNVLHLQFPFPDNLFYDLQTREMLSEYQLILVNSEFTREHTAVALSKIDLSIDIEVLHPPCGQPPESLKPTRKTYNKIISIGRFFTDGHSKQHLSMINAFRDVVEEFPEAQLLLVGSIAPEQSAREYLESLRSAAEGLQIRFLLNPGRNQLLEEIESSAIYWHATGYGVHRNEPHKQEHFGIAIAEAGMRATIPFAFSGGGPTSILRNFPGQLYSSLEELASKTKALLAKPDVKLAAAISEEFVNYSDASFREGLESLLFSRFPAYLEK